MSLPIRVATFNIWHHLDGAGLGPRTFDDLRDLCATPDLVAAGLQEIVGNLDERDLPAGWNVYQPGRNPSSRADRERRKDPIVYRDHLTILERGTRRVSDRIENSAGAVAGRHATWIVTPEWALVNCHLNAAVEDNGRPVHIPRQREHEDALHTLVDIADDIEREHGVPVLIVGDLNVDYGADKRVQHPEFPYRIFTAAGFACCWELGEQSTRTGKPNRGRTIDQVWGRGGVTFTGVDTPTHWGGWARGDVESDHLPVLVDLTLTETETGTEDVDMATARQVADEVLDTKVDVWRGDEKRSKAVRDLLREYEEEQDRQAQATEALHADVRRLLSHLGV